MIVVIKGVLMGLGATVLMDLWALTLARLAGVPLPNWALVGRWFRHLPEGKVFHDDIGAAPAFENELRVGWIAHYGVGLIYGVVFAIPAGREWLASPSFLPAWFFGIVTVGFGWFLLQPGLGLGWAASKTENPTKVRVLNLLAHTVFGIGLWLVALFLT